MKTIVAGSRSITSYTTVESIINQCPWTITEVVSGTARGVDELGEAWAVRHKTPIKRFPADWTHYGRSAGYRRNKQMANYADALIAIWDGKSKGTAHMIDLANEAGLKVHVVIIPT